MPCSAISLRIYDRRIIHANTLHHRAARVRRTSISLSTRDGSGQHGHTLETLNFIGESPDDNSHWPMLILRCCTIVSHRRDISEATYLSPFWIATTKFLDAPQTPVILPPERIAKEFKTPFLFPTFSLSLSLSTCC